LCVKIPADGEVYSIQHYVIKFVSELQEVCSLSVNCRRSVVLQEVCSLSVTYRRSVVFPGTPVSSKKTDHHDITEILLKVALNTITLGGLID